MNEPNLTPPTAMKAKAEKAPKPKKEKVAKEPNGEKKPRAPRQDYGYRLDATIAVLEDKSEKYRGDRKDWFLTVKAYEGKTVGEWLTATKKEGGDPPRGWLRFFVQDGSVSLKGNQAGAVS